MWSLLTFRPGSVTCKWTLVAALLLPLPVSALQYRASLPSGSSSQLGFGASHPQSSESSERRSSIVALTDGDGRTVYINAADPTLPLAIFRNGLSEIGTLIEETAGRFRVDPNLVHAVVRVESGYNPRALSPKGAMGLMQLIPATARRFGVGDAYDPKQNIQGGVSYLRYLLDRFGGDVPLSLAAYDAGERAVEKRGGIPPYNETLRYVQKITSLYQPGTRGRQASKLARDGSPGRTSPPIFSYLSADGVVHFEQ